MVRSPCCDEAGVKKGPWTPEEDEKLTEYIKKHGHGSWRQLPLNAGLNRCGKSCRLRWTNYLRPDIKRGKFSEEEERLIIHLHSILGNKWSLISTKLQGRTDNEIKNHWNTHLKKKLLIMGIDPVTHHRRPELTLLANLPNLLSSSNSCHSAANSWDSNALKLQAEAAHQLAQAQILQSLFHALFASSPNTNSPSNLNANSLLFSPSLSPLRSIADIFEASRRIEAFMSHLSSFGHAHDPVLAESYEFGNHTKSQQLMSELNNAYGNQHVMIDSKNMTKPTEVYTAPENCTSSVDMKQGGHLCSSEISPDNSESSTPLPVWDELHLSTDPDVSDLGWRDILEEIAW